MARRSRLRAVILLPLGFVLFIIGWTTYFVGSKKNRNRIKYRAEVEHQPDLQVGVLPLEEQKVI